MLTALFLVSATGLVWIGVGVAFSAAAKSPGSFLWFMVIQSLISTIAAALLVDFRALNAGHAPHFLGFAIAMGIVAFLSSLGFGAMRKAMATGSHGIVWTISQAALVLPFLSTILIWHEKAGAMQLTGLALLLASLPLCSKKSGLANGRQASSRGWLVYAFSAFVMIGLSQIVNIIPSKAGWTDSASIRLPLLFLFSTFFWLAAIPFKKEVGFTGGKSVLSHAAIYALAVLAGQFLLFRSLDAMAALGMACRVYPIAIGICIGGFFLYSAAVLKERAGLAGWAGATCAIAGAVLLSCK